MKTASFIQKCTMQIPTLFGARGETKNLHSLFIMAVALSNTKAGISQD